jgi:hypothetical protein
MPIEREDVKRVLEAIGKAVLLILAGVSLGWIVGLSSTPVVATVLPALLTLVIGVATALSGTDAAKGRTMLYPAAFLVVGAGIGIAVGVVAKSHAWLSPAPGELADQWKELPRHDVMLRLFDRAEPPPPKETADTVARGGGLWASSNTCGYYMNAADGLKTTADMKSAMERYKLPFATLADVVTDPDQLRKATVQLCRLSMEGKGP